MDLEKLHQCPYIEDLKERGATVSFKIHQFVPSSEKIEVISIEVPVSGNWLLIEGAKVLSPETLKTSIDLPGVFLMIEGSVDTQKQIKSKEKVVDPMDDYIQEAAAQFFERAEDDLLKDKEVARFEFLRVCSQNFEIIFEQNKI